MGIRKNRLRQLLNEGKPTLGTRLHSPWPTTVELVGHAGFFDYVEILAEYAPYSLFSLENQGRAIDIFEHMTGMLKVGETARPDLAVRGLNSGIQNLLFADVRTVADVEECVRCVRAESPETKGLRGVGQGRDVALVLEVGTAAYVQSTTESVVALMIEKKEAVENIDALLSVPGVDMVQFGPADYAMSLGLTGQREHPAVREAERHVIECALKKGIAPRAELNLPQQGESYLEMGVRHFCMGTDVRILYTYYKEQGGLLKNLLSALAS